MSGPLIPLDPLINGAFGRDGGAVDRIGGGAAWVGLEPPGTGGLSCCFG